MGNGGDDEGGVGLGRGAVYFSKKAGVVDE